MSRLFAGTAFDQPKTCDTCRKPMPECRCIKLPDKKKMSEKPGGKHHEPNRLDSGLVLNAKNAVAPADQVARIRVEKRKGNRMVTVIGGLEHPGNDLPAICIALKQSLGAGGSVQGRTIELQGEHADKAAALLQEKKIKTRIV